MDELLLISRFAVEGGTHSKSLANSVGMPPVIGVDLFAGAGGFSHAATLSGIRIAAAIEIDPNACRTYRRNFIKGQISDPYLFQADIRSLDPAAMLEQVPALADQGCDVLIGGPPCQGFSVHRINNRGIGDPRNELLIRYFDFVQALQPKVFFVENVPGLLWPRHANFLQRFLRLADELGYDLIGPKVLNARDYGVPQNRRRVFILGVRRTLGIDVSWPPGPTHRPIGPSNPDYS